MNEWRYDGTNFGIKASCGLDPCTLNAPCHANSGVRLTNALYNKRNKKLPQAVTNAADKI